MTSSLTRRQFLYQSTAALPLLTGTGLWAGQASDVRSGPATTGLQLFLDEAFIAEKRDIRRVIESPVRHPSPVVTAADKSCQPYVSVLRDPVTGRFRLWYNTAIDTEHSHIGYMESQDGVNFERPGRELPDPSGLPVRYGAYVLDHGPAAPDPSRRYLLAWENQGLFTAHSADGLAWTATSREPVLIDIGDIIALSRDPIRNRYLLTCKLHSTPEDGFKGRAGSSAEGERRLVGQSYSADGIRWSAPQRIVVPDHRDEGVTEFYSVGNVIARGGLLIGLLKVLRDDQASEPGGAPTGIGYTCLAWTRDGITWQRDREPFMDRNPNPGTWDRAMTWGDCLLPVDDEVFVYYGGYALGHKIERFKGRQIGVARMKRDRFVAQQAGSVDGTLVTAPFTVAASQLTLNAAVSGHLIVEVVDSSGKALKGFSRRDCEPVTGDSLAHAVRWKSPLARLRGKKIQLRFSMRDARLYALDLAV